MQFVLTQQHILRNSLFAFCVGLLLVVLPLSATAQFNPEINYQGKLTNASGVAVPDGLYNMNFWLVPTQGGATSTAVWSEARTSGDRVQVTNGLFSVMLGEVATLDSVDFNQTLYLGVEIGGISTTTPAWDGEMSPRKIIGAVPAAFVAETASSSNALSGIASSSFLRSDQADTMEATSSSPILSVIQNGAGAIARFFSGVTEVFTILNNGNVGVGTSTPSSAFAVSGTTTLAGNLITTGTSTLASTTISRLTLGTALSAVNGGTGLSSVTQNQLLIGGAGNTWTQVATSSLGLGNGTFLGLTDTPSSYTANRVVFTNSGATALTDSADLVFTGTNFGIGTTTPAFKLQAEGNLFSTQIFAGSMSYRNANGFAVNHSDGPGFAGAINAVANGGEDTNAAIHAAVFGGDASDYNRYGLITMSRDSSGWYSSSIGAHLAGDYLGAIGFAGQTDTSPSSGMEIGASIAPQVDGTVSSGVLPTAITFRTSQTNDAGLTERMRITSAGNIGIGTSTPANRLTVVGSGASNPFVVASSTGESLLTVLRNGYVGIGYGISDPDTPLYIRGPLGDLITLNSGNDNNVGTIGYDYTGTGLNLSANNNGNIGTMNLTDYYAAFTFNGNTIVAFGEPGLFGLNSPSPVAVFDVRSSSTTAPTILAQATTSQTANLLELRNSAGTPLSVFDVNGNLGLGTTTPASKLSVAGDLRLTGAFRDASNASGTLGMVLQTTGTSTRWVATSSLGISSGATTFLALTDTPSSYTANRVIFTNTGATALTDSANFTFDGTNLGLGAQSRIAFGGTNYIYASSTNDSIVFGENAGATFTSGTIYNTALGFEAGRYASTSAVDYNNFIGYQAGRSNTGDSNNIFGYQAGYNNTGSSNNLLGSWAGYSNTGAYNNLFGVAAGEENDGGSVNAFGYRAGQYNSDDDLNTFGYESGRFNQGFYNNFMGPFAGSQNEGSAVNAFGLSAGSLNTGSSTNLFGPYAGYSNTGDFVNAFGSAAGYSNAGDFNEFYGAETAGLLNASATVAIGSRALRGAGTIGVTNAFTAINNVAIGFEAGTNATTTANNNILIGYRAADNLTTGNNNIIIGYDIDNVTATADNRLNIGNLIFGTGLDGTGTTLASGNVGIGTTSPAAKLDVWGSMIVGTSSVPMFYALSEYGIAGIRSAKFNDTLNIGNGGSSAAGLASIGLYAPIDHSAAQSFDDGAKIFSVSSISQGGGYYQGGAVVRGMSADTGVTGLNLYGYQRNSGTVTTPTVMITGGKWNGASAATALTGTDLVLGIGTSTNNPHIASFMANGNVGIGTTTQASRLTVAGDMRLTGAFRDGGNASGTLGMVLQSTGTSTRWVATSTLGFGGGSLFTDGGATTYLTATGDNLAIGTTSASSKLTIEGDIAISTNVNLGQTSVITVAGERYIHGYTLDNTFGVNQFIGYQSGNFTLGSSTDQFLGIDNLGIGRTSLSALTEGSNNTAVGAGSMSNTTTGSGNTGVGWSALTANTTGYANAAFGNSALFNNTTGYSNVAIGSSALGANITGYENIAIGEGALSSGTSSSRNVAIGQQSLQANTAGGGNSALGWQSLISNTTGNDNSAFGFASLYSNTSGNNNSAFGLYALNQNTTGEGNVALGWRAGDDMTTGSRNIIIGYNVDAASTTADNQLTIGNLIFGTGLDGENSSISSGNIGIGTSTPGSKLTVEGDIRLGANDAINFGADDIISYRGGNVTFGLYALINGLTAGSANVAIGNEAANSLSDGSDNVFLGDFAGLRLATSSGSVVIGRAAAGNGYGGTDAGNLVILGTQAGYNLETGGYASTFLGYKSGENVTSGHGNTLIGWESGANITTGARNILIGHNVDAASTTADNTLNIGNLLFGTGLDGENSSISSGNIGIGTSTPGSKLTVAGDMRVTTGIILGTEPGVTLAVKEGNLAFGTYALATTDFDNIYSNTAIGMLAANSLEDGWENTFIGDQAGVRLATTSSSVVIGAGAVGGGYGTTEAGGLVVIGRRAGYNLETGAYANTLIGQQAGVAVTTGNLNTLLGYQVADNLTTGSNNIVIGSEIDAASTTANDTLNIGNLIFGTGLDGTGTTLSSGNIGIGTTTPQARLALERLNFNSTTGAAGIDQYFSFNNSSNGATIYGNRSYIYATNTATTTVIGSILRVADSTTFGNTVRGLEVQADSGNNTLGENTGIAAFARTFGVRGTTVGDAGGTFEPAGVYGETEGTTQGNAIRGYSSSITTAALLKLFQDTSAFTGTGLLMNFGNAGGSFSSTTASRFIDLQNAGSSRFTVNAYGMTTIGNGGTVNNAGLQIGYGGICVDNDGSCNASTTGRISAVSYHTGNSDLAETYFSSENLKTGEVVYLKGELSIGRASEATEEKIIGVVTTKPGLLLGFDDTSLRAGEEVYGVALAGRVPVRLSNENGEIKAGDELMLSSIPGVAMKASSTGVVVGIALEDFEETRAYSDIYINQFGDDLVDPVVNPINPNSDPRINDGCYYGAGSASGDTPCIPLIATSTDGQVEEAQMLAEAEAQAAALEALKDVRSEVKTLPNGETVRVGQIVMFVSLDKRYLDEDGKTMIAALLAAGEGADEDGAEDTIWNRLVTIANNFVDGVLSVFTLKADRVEVQNEICVDGVCLNAEDIRQLLDTTSTPEEPEDEPEDTPTESEPEEDTEPVPPDEPPTEEETATSTEEVSEEEGEENLEEEIEETEEAPEEEVEEIQEESEEEIVETEEVEEEPEASTSEEEEAEEPIV